uniref:SAV_2336 N-terminal domain-related protein n=1 Tax=Plectonema radiosum TaxID=945768 RepID=UPI0035C93E87
MIERSLAILQQAGFDFTARELADILWLAVHMERSRSVPQVSLEQSPQELTKPATPQPDSSKPVDTSKPEATEPPVILDQDPTSLVVLPPHPTEKPSTTDNTEAIPIKIPAAAALRNSLALGRALRPLMRKVPSSTEKILDEQATVQRFAEDEIGIPVLKSTPERWLELALVVEETSITEIWEQTIREFQQLLKYHGAFRDVRTWKLKSAETSTQTKIQLFAENSTGFDNFTPHKPDILIDPKGRRLILLVSDCISPIWRKKLIHPVLELWGKRGLITILQLLPERFWERTALVDQIPVLLSACNAGVYNSQLIAQLWDEDDIDEFADKNKSEILKSLTSIPVITLEPEPLLIWSKVIAGQGNISTAGFKFNSHPEAKTTTQSLLPTPQLSALESDFSRDLENPSPNLSPKRREALNSPPSLVGKGAGGLGFALAFPHDVKSQAFELVNLFRANASLQARRLAGLMAAVPVSISVVHQIQQTLLKESTQIHVAEVFMSGLLKRLPSSDHPDYIAYEFVDGVRELLRDFVPPHQQISVLDKISEFIRKRLGLSINEFEALLLTHDNNALEAKIRPFAQLKAEVLRQLGGSYALEAEKLDLSQFVKKYAGEYICAVKWAGETGIWQKESQPEHLLISQQGEVQFRSRFGLAVIQNVKVERQTLSWDFDDNQTAASITFQVNSEDSYFWESQQTGKLFQGWLNYPNEGKIDFRGRFNLQIFEFEVALIKVNQPAQISRDNLPEIADEMIFTKTGKHLNDTEQLVIQGTLANQTYEQIAVSAEYSVRHLKNVAIKLWGVLSEVFGEKVTKKNLKANLEQLVASRHLTIHRHRQTSQYFIEDLGNGVQLEMVAIPEGSFIMGSPADEAERREDESPQHEVTIAPFYMGKYPVTQAQWQAVAALPQVNSELNPEPSYFKGENRPVERVSWYDTQEFCDRLSRQTGKPYRLPSEAEWEYACRAGTTTPFHFGETITSELANYHGNYTYGSGVKGTYRGETTEVGSFGVANAFGLYDMHGLVWEWCADHWHNNYDGAPTDGSAWISDNDNRSLLLRGGSWFDFPGYCRSAIRSDYNPVNDFNTVGFRVVCAGAIARILRP